MQSETKPCIFPKAKAAPEGFSGEERLAGGSLVEGELGIGAETVESIQDEEGGGEAGRSLNLRR